MNPKRLIYILDGFPSYTLNFIYNEIDTLESEGFAIDIFSLMPTQTCPEEARRFLPRVTNIRPVPAAAMLRAWLYYLLRRPLALLGLLLRLPFDNPNPARGLRALAHMTVAVHVAWRLRDRREHLHAHFAAKSTLTALVVSRLNGNPYSFTAHGSSTVFPPKRISLASKIHGAEFIVAISDFNKRTILELCPDYPAERIVVNRSGILLDQFPVREPGEREGGPFRLVCIASLHHYKNHETLIEAARILVDRGIEFRIDCLGGDVDGRLAVLEAHAERLGVTEQVRFLGRVDHGEIVSRLREADLSVLSSQVEGVPVSMMEAMAGGTPVLGPRITGVPELVEDGVSGFLADPERPEEFAEKAARILLEPELVRGFVARARERVEERYDMRANARALAAAFQDRVSA